MSDTNKKETEAQSPPNLLCVSYAAMPSMGTERVGLGQLLGNYLIGANALDLDLINQRIQVKDGMKKLLVIFCLYNQQQQQQQ
jgi:hypothetical protein